MSENECVRCHETCSTRDGDEPTPECDHCAHELLDELRAENGKLREELLSMVQQHCADNDPDGKDLLNAYGLSANRDAMKLLAELGLIELTGGNGRCITGHVRVPDPVELLQKHKEAVDEWVTYLTKEDKET